MIRIPCAVSLHGIRVDQTFHEQRCMQGGDRGLSVADIGSGAGLPAFIIAIAKPTWQVVAMDTLKKRCKFMEETAQSLGLQVSIKCPHSAVAALRACMTKKKTAPRLTCRI